VESVRPFSGELASRNYKLGPGSRPEPYP